MLSALVCGISATCCCILPLIFLAFSQLCNNGIKDSCYLKFLIQTTLLWCYSWQAWTQAWLDLWAPFGQHPAVCKSNVTYISIQNKPCYGCTCFFVSLNCSSCIFPSQKYFSWFLQWLFKFYRFSVTYVEIVLRLTEQKLFLFIPWNLLFQVTVSFPVCVRDMSTENYFSTYKKRAAKAVMHSEKLKLLQIQMIEFGGVSLYLDKIHLV